MRCSLLPCFIHLSHHTQRLLHSWRVMLHTTNWTYRPLLKWCSMGSISTRTKKVMDLILLTLMGVVLSKGTPLFPNPPALKLDNTKVDPLRSQTMTKKLVCQICNKRNHTALKCFNRFNHSFTPEDVPQALAAMKIVDTQDGDWFPISGLLIILLATQVISILLHLTMVMME
jgi:hypothetical protein